MNNINNAENKEAIEGADLVEKVKVIIKQRPQITEEMKVTISVDK